MKKFLGKIVGESDDGEVSRQIILKFKARDGDKWRRCDDISSEELEYLFPEGWWEELKETEERLKEELGGGIWHVEERRGGKYFKRHVFRILDTRITYPIVQYRIKIKKSKNSRLWRTDVTFDHFPTEKELVEAVGGGGIFKIEGVDDQGSVVTVDWVEVDEDPPEWLIKKEDDIESKIKERIEQRKKKIEEEIVSKILGEEKPEDPVDQIITEVHKLVQDEKLKLVKETLETLKDKKKGEGFFDVLFIEPHKTKMETLSYIAKKLADQGEPEKAAKLLTQNLADGSEALVSLLGGFAAFLNAGAIYLARKAGVSEDQIFRKRKEKTEEKKAKEEEKEKVEIEEEIKTQVTRVPGQMFKVQIFSEG